MISATIITIGDELLIGQTIDTNSAWIAQEFNKIGIEIRRRIAISDNETEIFDTLNEAQSLSEIIITTGGLGPTNDDITKATLCKFFSSHLIKDEKTEKHIIQFFEQRKREILQVNLDQASVPHNCTVLFNAVGTAPGLQFERDNKFYFSLPGVPFEMKHLISERIIPTLKKNFKLGGLLHKTIITSGMGESFIANRLQDFENKLDEKISLAYLPNFGMVKLRLSTSQENEEALHYTFEELKNQVSDIQICDEDKPLEKILFDLLKKESLKIAVAESCTGGNIAANIVSLSGASSVFKGSTVTYAIESKQKVLGVLQETLDKHTDVSKETATEMSENVRKLFNAEIGLSTTGFLEGAEQYFFTSISSEEKTLTKKFILPYGRKLNSNLAVSASLQFAIRFLQKKQRS
jgi:nicotinamide-nucleotide amidase